MSERTVDWYDRAVQPRCNICGRFAAWDEQWRRWVLKCVTKLCDAVTKLCDADGGGYEHE